MRRVGCGDCGLKACEVLVVSPISVTENEAYASVVQILDRGDTI